MDRERKLELLFTVVGAGTAAYWVVILFMRHTFPFEGTEWHFAAGGILAVLSIGMLLAWFLSPSSPSAREPRVIDDTDDTSLDDSSQSMISNEEPTAPDAGVLVDEPPLAPCADESDRRPANPPVSLANLAQTVRPAVVRIQTASGSGSGFIVNAHGNIVTNRHVVGHNPRVVVRLDDGPADRRARFEGPP
jgi:S1-C subfamily serine protease